MAIKIRQEISIIDDVVTGATAANDNGIIQLDTAQYVNPTYYFEADIGGAASNTGTVTLRRNGTTTDDASLTGRTTATITSVRSTAFTPPGGRTEYIVRNNADGTRSQTINAARIIVIDNPTTLVSTQTQIEIGMNKTGLTSSVSSPKVVPDSTLTKYWKYTAALWNGTMTFYAEVTYLMASSKSGGTFILQEDDGAFGTWTDKVTIVSAGVATVATRVRSASFTPTDGRNYRIAYFVASSKSAASIFNGKVIVDQTPGGDIIQSNSNQSGVIQGTGGTSEAEGQTFTTVETSIASIAVALRKIGSPTDNLYITLASSVGGTPIATSESIAGSTLQTSFVASGNWTGFNFPSPVSVSNSTIYFIAVQRDGARDTNNYYQDNISNSDVYTGGSRQTLASGSWSADVTRDIQFIINPVLTLLEPQYLLLNTANTSTGLQSYPTLYDSTEWSGVTNTYKHAMDSNNAANNTKIEDTTSSTVLTTSSVTGANQQISGDMFSQLVTGDTLDTDIVTATGVIAASRILVAVSVNAVITALNIQRAISDIQNAGGTNASQGPQRASYY